MSFTFGPLVLFGLGALFFFLLCAAGLALLLPRRSARKVYESVERGAMPQEIATGRLFASERFFASRGPLPLNARVDQVYQAGDHLVCVETKTRKFASVTESDLIEMSVQAYVLRTHRHRTAPYGYVRLVLPGRHPRYEKVELLGDDRLAMLVHRYREIHAGRAPAARAPDPRRCARCPQAPKCPHYAYLASNPRQFLQSRA